MPGFRKFVLRNAEPYRDEPIAPDNWMFYYKFSDKQLARLPELSGLKSRDYFKTLYPALRRENILPAAILPEPGAGTSEHRPFPVLHLPGSARNTPQFAAARKSCARPGAASVQGLQCRENVSGSVAIHPDPGRQ